MNVVMNSWPDQHRALSRPYLMEGLRDQTPPPPEMFKKISVSIVFVYIVK